MKEDNNLYFEDALLTRQVIWVLERKHDFHVEKLYRHVKINSFEIDAVAIVKTSIERYERWVGFELKETAIDKAVGQALDRREFFDYFYVVIDLSCSSIVYFLIKYPQVVINDGIGFISSYDEVVVSLSKYKPRIKLEKAVEGREIDSSQLKLIQFLEKNKRRGWKL